MRLCLDAIIQFSKTRGHVGMGEELGPGESAESTSRIRVPGGDMQDDQGSQIEVTGLRRIESEITSQAPPNDSLANGMRAGSLAVACLADVPDGPILGRNTAGVLGALRTPEPGQLYKYHLGRLDWVDEMVASHGLRRALSAADLDGRTCSGATLDRG